MDLTQRQFKLRFNTQQFMLQSLRKTHDTNEAILFIFPSFVQNPRLVLYKQCFIIFYKEGFYLVQGKTYCLKNKAYVLNLLAQETRRDGIISSVKEKTQFCPSYLATNSKILSPFKVSIYPTTFSFSSLQY